MPRSSWPYLDHDGILAFAHRGGTSHAPENTLPAFAHAVSLGYCYLETDVHITADGVLVAFHDHVLDRVTDGTGRIADLPWSEVSQAKVGTERIPLLEEILDAFPEARVNIDPKHDAAVEPLAELLHQMGAIERVGIGAFSDERLRRMRRLCGPRLCTSLGPRDAARLTAAARGLPIRRLPAPCVQVPRRRGRLTIVDARFVAAAHRRGLQVHVWTVNEPEEMHALLDLGVDGLMTDQPAVLKDVLTARGRWG